MQYQPPIGASDPDQPYIDGNASTGTEGSPVPAAAIEHPMREIQNAIIAAGLIPEENTLDQLAQAIKILAPSPNILGQPFWHLGEILPLGAMQFEGQVLDRSEYSELWNSLNDPDRNIKLAAEADKTANDLQGCWGLGDDSTTFTVPDVRGEFIRVWESSRGVDSGRTLGSWQADLFKSHAHKDAWARDNNNVDYGGGVGGRYRSPGTGYTTSSAGGSETRPRNVAWMLCFYY
jgi:hypothetical protein